MLNFPEGCETSADKTEYAYRAQELLRLLHNTMGRWYNEGISEAEWSRLPARIQLRYPYKDKLFGNEWREFRINFFEPASERIVGAIVEQRALLKQSTRWNIDIEAF